MRYRIDKRLFPLFALPALAASASAQIIFDPNIGIMEPFQLQEARPKLVVLIHGITPHIHEEDPGDINTIRHTRKYWGGEFVRNLQGLADSDDMHIVIPRTIGGLQMTYEESLWGYNDEDFKKLNYTGTELAPISFPTPWLNYLPPDYRTNQAFIKDFIKFNTRIGVARPAMVMTTFRDGSKHLMPQVGDTVDQIYGSYIRTFGHLPAAKQPQLYLVGHSFGGIIARAIMNLPAGPDLYGNRLSSGQMSRAKWIRDRVVNISTIATPHHGTPLADLAPDVSAEIRELVPMLSDLLRRYDFIEEAKTLTDMMPDILAKVSGERPCLQDILRMEEYNGGILNPSLHKRSDGTKVPIYTLDGRQPGGLFFDRFRGLLSSDGAHDQPHDIIDVFTSGRPGFEAGAQYLINALLHIKGYGLEGKRPWGTALHPDLDRRISPFTGFGPSRARPLGQGLDLVLDDLFNLLQFGVYAPPYLDGRDSENDSDGFVGLLSGHGVFLNGGAFFRLVNSTTYGAAMPWDNDNHGSECFNPGTGAYLFNEIVQRTGPFVYQNTTRFGSWNPSPPPAKPSHSVTVDPIQLYTIDGGADGGDDELVITIEIGGQKKTIRCPEGDVVNSIPSFTVTGLTQSVVPIKISVHEEDNPPVDPHDNCALTPQKGRDNLVLYYDTQSYMVLGDVKGQAGHNLFAKGTGEKERVALWFSVTGN